MQRWLYQLQQATVLNATIISGSSNVIHTPSPAPQQLETTPEPQVVTKTKKSGGFFSRSKRQPS